MFARNAYDGQEAQNQGNKVVCKALSAGPLYVTFLVQKDVTLCSVCDEIWHLRGALRQLLYGDFTYGTYPYNLCNYFLYEIPGQ